ncbi:hypothetical protein Mapa_001411 [Marchantia paleacea]|nr:hypothetical protein Mapa_001411 [Marchantia paleacea]
MVMYNTLQCSVGYFLKGVCTRSYHQQSSHVLIDYVMILATTLEDFSSDGPTTCMHHVTHRFEYCGRKIYEIAQT